MDIRIIESGVSIDELIEASRDFDDELVKAVVDIKRGIMAIGGSMHSDEETTLLDDGSEQDDLWGINIYPGRRGEDWVEFDSMINIRPRQGNRARNVEKADLREKIIKIVEALVKR